MARAIEVEVTIPELPEGKKKWNVGDTFMVAIEIPGGSNGKRGQLAGIELADMTDEQLKRERINAKSVLYKAKKRGADQGTIDANQARVDAVEAEIASRKALVATAEATEATEATEAEATTEAADEGVYDAATASEM